MRCFHRWSSGGSTREDTSARCHRGVSAAIAVETGTSKARYDSAFDIVGAIGRLGATLNEHVQFAIEPMVIIWSWNLPTGKLSSRCNMVLAPVELLAPDREALAANGAELIGFPKIDGASIVTLARIRAAFIGASGASHAVCNKAA